MKKAELLAPAGNMDALKAAVAAGCDAVYLGMQIFSARAFAGNFSHEELQEAVRYCHIRDVRVYVTVNTMLFETEIENAKKEIDFLYRIDVDALLIQDLGLFHYVRTCYPDFDVHCSTQMHVHNLAGVRFMQEEGAARAVIARESPLELIREACATGMEVEAFVYGAICISYSGQCLMSASVKNRSANRGMCAQCCRLKYYPDSGSFPEGEYILSPKDLNVINELPQLLDTGVCSLKIEGRMKRPEYVYLVTRTFREAIDAYYEGKHYKVSAQRTKELLLMFNRGFSKGHLFHAGTEERMSHYRPNHVGINIGTVLQYKDGQVQVKLTDTLYQHDGLRILNVPHDTGLTAVKITLNGKLVSKAEKGDVVWLECTAKPKPRKGQKLQKTTDAVLLEKIRRQIGTVRRSPIRMTYTAKINRPFALQAEDDRGNSVWYESSFITQKAKNAPLSRERIAEALMKTGEEPYEVIFAEGDMDDIFLPVSVLNEARRAILQQLSDIRAILHGGRGEPLPYQVSVSEPEVRYQRLLISQRDMDIPEDPRWTVAEETAVVDEDLADGCRKENMVLSEIGDLYHIKDGCIGGMTLNIANSYSIAYAMQKGLSSVILSSEMNNDQIRMTLQAFEKRYGFEPKVYRLVYGRRVLMYIKNHFRKDTTLNAINDLHGNNYKVVYNNKQAEILEPEAYVSSNPYCWGSYLIPDASADYKEIVEEAYEEIHGRV
ncbi:MAG: U32 family peptidase [Solobacterium sp.]|nr:U32 family peptidase [Solobacterium sp.]